MKCTISVSGPYVLAHAPLTDTRIWLSNRYEKQLEQEEQAYQQQRRRLYAEVQEEKERLALQGQRQRQELDEARAALEVREQSDISTPSRGSLTLVVSKLSPSPPYLRFQFGADL